MKRILVILSIILPVFTIAQNNVWVKEVNSDLNTPEITWITTGSIDTMDFHIFRSALKDTVFYEIHTTHYVKPYENSDTLEFTMFDTTLTKKAIYLYYIKAHSGDKVIASETAMAHNFGYIPPPQLNSFTATPLTDRKAIKLGWKISYIQTVSSMELFRSKSWDTGYVKIADLSPDMADFTDVAPIANEPLFYFITIHTYFGNTIKSVRTPAYATFAEKPFPPHNLHAAFKNDSVIIDWTNVGKNIIGYRVYRSIGDQPFHLMNDMNNGVGEKIVFIDTGKELKKAIKLRYYVRNVSDGFAESNITDTISFYLAEHEPVFPPEEVDFIRDNYGNIKFMWVEPDKGLTTGYNIYLISNGDTVKLNKTVLKNNFFTDSVYRSKGKYRYEVEGVGLNDKVSDLRTPVTVYRYNPQIHVIVDLKKGPSGIIASWKHPLNPHVDKILLYKQFDKTEAAVIKSFAATADVTFTDKHVKKGTTYLYKLVAQMENGDKIVVNDGVQLSF